MTLEDQYRRRLRLFPKQWRRENQEDLLGVLLEAAKPDQVRVSVGESVNLAVSASKIWIRIIVQSVALGRLIGLGALVTFVLALALVNRLSSSVSPEFLATSLIVVLVPGTGVVYTVASAIGGGWRRGSVAAVGCTLGIVPHLLAAMIGLSGVMQAGAAVFEIMRWVGVAYLAFMGFSMIRSGGALQLDGAASDQDERPLSIIRRGILLNVLNPKLTLFFFAFLPQFLDSTPTILDSRLLLLAAIFMAMTLLVFLAYAYASAAVRERVLESPTMLTWIQRSLGTLLIGFAARLAIAER